MTSKGIPISSAVFENFFFINLICGPINKISAFSISFVALSCATAQISVSIPFASAVSFIFDTNKLVDIIDELDNKIRIIIIHHLFLYINSSFIASSYMIIIKYKRLQLHTLFFRH